MNYEDWQLDALREVQNEIGSGLGGRNLKIVEFVSRSRGRNARGERIPRKPREVGLLVVDNQYALPINRGELRKSKRNPNALEPDCLAQEILGQDGTPDELVRVVKRRQFR